MISKNSIDTANRIYENLEVWKLARHTITKYFDNNKHNSDKQIVLIKVVLINSLYKTQLSEPISVAEHIFRIKDLDNRLKGDLSIVENIAKCKNRRGKIINILSFASKFCHFHYKEIFPIYDKYVCMALKNITGYKDKRDYETFKQNVEEVKIRLNAKDFEEIDTFLWLYGQKLRLEELDRKGKKRDIIIKVSELYDNNRELFESLQSVEIIISKKE